MAVLFFALFCSQYQDYLMSFTVMTKDSTNHITDYLTDV